MNDACRLTDAKAELKKQFKKIAALDAAVLGASAPGRMFGNHCHPAATECRRGDGERIWRSPSLTPIRGN
jgi:hypothetical protein